MYDFYYIGKFSLIGIRKLTLVIPIQSIIIIYFLQCLAIDNQKQQSYENKILIATVETFLNDMF